MEQLFEGYAMRFLLPSAAEFSLDGDLFFMISRSEIMKNKSPSKYYLVQSAKKSLFTQPQIKSFAAKPWIPLVNSYR